jgi:hypothetical protein
MSRALAIDLGRTHRRVGLNSARPELVEPAGRLEDLIRELLAAHSVAWMEIAVPELEQDEIISGHILS